MAVRPLWDLRQATLAVFTGGGTCQSSSLPISTSVGWGGGGSALHLSRCQGSDAS